MRLVYGQTSGFVSFFGAVLPQLEPIYLHNFYARKSVKSGVLKGEIVKIWADKKEQLKEKSKTTRGTLDCPIFFLF